MLKVPPAPPKSTTIRPLGRPRTLNLETIIVAAVDVGLENFTMSAVAARLGVGVATLYSYVESRDALKALVASRRLAFRTMMEDKGQPWQELVMEHARKTFSIFTSEPQLLVQYAEGAMAPIAELEGLEYVLAFLVKRGFTVYAAYELYQNVSFIVMGAALGAVHIMSMQANGAPYGVAARIALAQRDPQDVAHVAECAMCFTDEARFHSYERNLNEYMRRIAIDRGEEPVRLKVDKRSKPIIA